VAKEDMNKLVMNFLVTEVTASSSSSTWQRCRGSSRLHVHDSLGVAATGGCNLLHSQVSNLCSAHQQGCSWCVS
jgi:hypothetical protein